METSLEEVYDAFFDLINDDMYMEISKEETMKDCFNLLRRSIVQYEFPDKVITIEKGHFNRPLSLEEINILATGMVVIWLQRQINSCELTRQHYTTADFKSTSQAAHLQRLTLTWQAMRDEHRRLQMLDSRRRINGDMYESTFDRFVAPMKKRNQYE